MGAGPRGFDVARKATWQCHADPRSAYVARNIFIVYYYYIYKKMGLQPSLDGKGINPLKCRELYTRHFLLFLSVWD